MKAWRCLPLLCVVLATACASPARDTLKAEDTENPGDSGENLDSDPLDTRDSEPFDSKDSKLPDTSDTDTGQELPWGEGPRAVSGSAWFFDMTTPGVLEWIPDVEGAEVWVYDAPALRATLQPEEGHAFRIEGIPEGAEVTLAVSHPDYFPHLTGTFLVQEHDLEDLNFQVVSNTIAGLVGGLLGADPADESTCQMATTVSAPGADSIWAPGEPGATVALDPPVPEEQGPFYFDERVIPDPSRVDTSVDGGVIVVGAEPGDYLWTGHKEGVEFEPLLMRCVGGWLTNAAPPRGMNARILE